jgi:hypothetical protein
LKKSGQKSTGSNNNRSTGPFTASDSMTLSHTITEQGICSFRSRAWSTKNQFPLVFPAAIPNLAPVIFCKPVKDQKPVLKTGQNHPQQIPVLPDCSEQNTARAEMNYSILVVDYVSGVKNVVEGWITGNKVVFHAKPPTNNTFKNSTALLTTKNFKKVVFCHHTCC